MALPHRTDRRRLRDAVRHQPPRPLRAHRPAARRLLATPSARVVTVSSNAHRWAACASTICNGSSGYCKWLGVRAEQARQPALRLRAAAPPEPRPAPTTISVACPSRLCRHQPAGGRSAHAGIVAARARRWGSPTRSSRRAPRWARCRSSTPPSLRGVRGGEYFGPDGLGELWGHPEEGELERALARPRGGAPAVGALRAADRRRLSGRPAAA